MSPSKRPVMGGIDVGLGAALLAAIWLGLPGRWAPVDVAGTAVAFGFLIAGAGLWTGAPWAERVARGVAALTLALGLLLVIGLSLTAGELSGLYGPIGMGGAVLLGVAAALVLPYLVIFPAAQLYALARAARVEAEGSQKKTAAENQDAKTASRGEDEDRVPPERHASA